VSFKHRWGQSLFQANYTYGHALDEISNGGFLPFTNATFLTPQNPNNLRGAYGPADYDVRHSFNANYIWELPVKHLLRDHGWDSLLTGWQISGTIFARTGFPYTYLIRRNPGTSRKTTIVELSTRCRLVPLVQDHHAAKAQLFHFLRILVCHCSSLYWLMVRPPPIQTHFSSNQPARQDLTPAICQVRQVR